MELKNYQKQVMNDLTSYLTCLNQSNHMISAWREYWFRQDVNVGLGGVPRIRIRSLASRMSA